MSVGHLYFLHELLLLSLDHFSTWFFHSNWKNSLGIVIKLKITIFLAVVLFIFDRTIFGVFGHCIGFKFLCIRFLFNTVLA